MRERVALLVWVGVLIPVIGLLDRLGHGPLAPPPLEPSAWVAWAQVRSPAVASIAVLRLGVIAVSWYLLVVTLLGAAARLVRAVRVVRIADALTLPVLRRPLSAAFALSFATVLASPAAVPAAALPIALVTAEPEPPSASEGPTALEATTEPDPPTAQDAPGEPEARPLFLELADPRPGPGATDPGGAAGHRDAEPREDPEAAAPSSEAAGVATDDGPGAEHLVVPGESFWSITRDEVAAVIGRPPTDAEVHTRWREVIEANRDRLVDRDNPDLILPGQRLVLPERGGPR